MFGWFRKAAAPPPPRRAPAAPARARSTPPAVSLRWMLGLSGLLADGSNESIRFRENIESPNIRLPELREWVDEALEDPHDEQRLLALQDIVNSLGGRLGFQVEYGVYRPENAEWMPFDGLWRLREDLYLAVEVFSEPLEGVDFRRLYKDLTSLKRNPAIAEAECIACFVTCAGVSEAAEQSIRNSRLFSRIRTLPLETLFELLRMDQEGVLQRAQLPVLFRPFSPVGVDSVLGFLERFIGAYTSDERPLTLPVEVEADPAAAPGAPTPAAEARLPPPPPPVPEALRPTPGYEDCRARYLAGDPEGATRDLREYLRAHPEDAVGWETLGDWARDRADVDTAQSAYQRSLDRDRERLGPLLALAAIHRERREFSQGLAFLDEVAPEPRAPAVLLERTRLLLALDRTGEAEESAQAAHAAGAGTDSLCLLARARRARRDLEGAEAALRTALEAAPGHAEARQLLDALGDERGAAALAKTGS